ncbi:MAG: hypothetical protein IJP86_03825 [Synergistaceae bacterium]|nr:hypothetical protein [Synergistaceae bacterium]
MKRTSYDHDAHMRTKTAASVSESDYARAMKTYKIFAHVSGIVITAAYVIAQLL